MSGIGLAGLSRKGNGTVPKMDSRPIGHIRQGAEMRIRSVVLGSVLSFTLTCGALISSLANAATLMPDFSVLNRSEQNLARSGDFDGDGRIDELYMVTEADTGRVAIHVRLNRADGPQDLRVTSLDSGNRAPNLHIAAPGFYQADCGSYTTDCATNGIHTLQDSLILGLDGDTTVLLHWQGNHFEQDFIRNDEARLARTFSVLYALNR